MLLIYRRSIAAMLRHAPAYNPEKTCKTKKQILLNISYSYRLDIDCYNNYFLVVATTKNNPILLAMTKAVIPLSNSVHYQIYKLALILGRELGRALRSYGLTPEQWQILVTLWTVGEPLSQTRIAQVTLKDKPSVSRLIATMESNGWIVRLPSKKDGRAQLIEPSKTSMEKKNEIINAMYRHFQPFQQKFGKENEKHMLDLAREYINIIME